MVKASRGFIAIRPTSYESAKERDFLKTLFVGRSGEVENTTFALLASDGKKPLSGISRSPAQVFGNATRMAAAMKKVLDANKSKENVQGNPVSPALGSVRLAVNVAACDNLPLVILGPKATPEVEKELTRLFFESQHKGHFVMARGTEADLAQIEGLKKESQPSLVMVQPDTFGLKSRALAQSDASDKSMILSSVIKEGFANFQQTAKDFNSHRISGTQTGAFWETALPVTDPQEKRARDRHPAAPKP